MNQEIQQNKIENKKPQMYLSFGWAFFGVVSVVFAECLGFFFSIQGAHAHYPDLGGVYLIGVFDALFLGGILLLCLFSIFMRPRYYIRTEYINSVFIGAILLTLLLMILLIAPGRLMLWFADLWAFDFVPYFLLPMVAGVSFTVFINHKFQKSETELGVTQ